MLKYDPMIPPDPEPWMEADEFERMDAVMRCHQKLRVKLPNEYLHAIIHAIIETQVILGAETPVAAKILQLQAEGLDRHEAIHAVGSALTQYIWKARQIEKKEGVDWQERYFEEVRAMTAQKWKDLASEAE